MEGFFTKKETESITRPDGKLFGCVACGLHKECHSPKMKPFGNFKKKILNIGEAPGETEDKTGKPWQGVVGKLLQKTYKEVGIDLFEDCLNINSVLCRPTDEKGGNRSPTNLEIDCCRKSVLQTIIENKPKVIVLFGNSALISIIGYRLKKDLGTISKWRGWTIPDQDLKCWILPTFHPSYVERSEGQEVETIWKQDLKRVKEYVETPFRKYKEPEIEIIEDLSVLNDIKNKPIAIDFETTGIKPHDTGHRIVSTAIADSYDHAYAFLMPKTRKELEPLLRLLIDESVGKIAQNMKFEHAWALVRLRTEIKKWIWDTMLVSHILDNRPGITGLKFQTYVQFGVIDYSSEVDPYLKDSDSTTANAKNRIMDLLTKPNGVKTLLKYNGDDAINEFRLWGLQNDLIFEHCLPF